MSKLTPYGRFLAAQDLPTPNGEYSTEAIDEMRAAFLDALMAPDPLPSEMQLHLASAFEHLCAGVAVPLLTPAPRKGGPARNVTAARLVEAAIRYLRWCDDRRILDNSPVSTVAASYGVHTQTVTRWLAEWRARPTPPIVDGWDGESVTRFMRSSAGAFRRLTKRGQPQDPKR